MPQGQKPALILLALYRDKSPAYRPNEFFRSLLADRGLSEPGAQATSVAWSAAAVASLAASAAE